MGVKIDLHYWTKKYEDDYPIEAAGKYPVFIDEKGVEHEERSPHFETMSAVLQKRGYLLKPEFVSIGNWKAERQKGRYENNTDEDVESMHACPAKPPFFIHTSCLYGLAMNRAHNAFLFKRMFTCSLLRRRAL